MTDDTTTDADGAQHSQDVEKVPQDMSELDGIVQQDPVEKLASDLRMEHDARFGFTCDDVDLEARETDDEVVVHCESCRFVVARLVKPDE